MAAGSDPTTKVTEESLRLLSLVERSINQRLDDVLKAYGSSTEQWRILSLLVERGGCPMNVVGDYALMLPPKLSKLIDRMVSMNLVLRRPDEQDRRRVLVAASPRGREALARWETAVAEVRNDLQEVLGPDAPLFHELLQRLSRGLDWSSTPTDGAAD